MIFIVNNLIHNEGISSKEKNTSGVKRFPASPLLGTLIRYRTLNLNFENYESRSLKIDIFKNRKKYKNYIVPTGVTHSPWDWTGYTDLDKKYDDAQIKRKTIFADLGTKFLRDLQKGKAYLLLDQSHEGYHTDWLFDWFHDACKKYELNADRIIYVTGNLAVEEQYTDWCLKNKPSSKMTVVPYIHFEEFIYDSAKKQKNVLPTVEDHLEYKSKNNIKTYNCFQKRARPHRIWMFHHLFKNDLLQHGINSMNSFAEQSSYYEGRVIDKESYKQIIEYLPMYPRQNLPRDKQELFKSGWGGSFEKDLYHQETRDSWVSVVSEASFAENTCFISEKSFKPIAARHPFMTYGNIHSLKYLKDLGYKTFGDYIDESYDNLDTWDRLDAIIKNLKVIQNMSHDKKLKWFAAMQPILDYNFEVLKDNTTTKIPLSIIKLQEKIGN